MAEPRPLSVIDRATDIALRLARPQADREALTWKIATVRFGLFTASDAIGHGTGRWIGYTKRMGHLAQAGWIDQLAGAGGNEELQVRVDDLETALAVACGGGGGTLLPLFMARSHSELRQIGAPAPVWSRELWIIVHPDLRNLPRIRTTIDWLTVAIRCHLASDD